MFSRSKTQMSNDVNLLSNRKSFKYYQLDRKSLYCTSCVGSHWAGKPITLSLTEEIVNGRAQKRAAFLLLTHQL